MSLPSSSSQASSRVALTPGEGGYRPTFFKRITRKLSLSSSKVAAPKRVVVLKSIRQVEDFTAQLHGHYDLEPYDIQVHLPKQEHKRKDMQLAVQALYVREALAKGTLKPSHPLHLWHA
ncbi:uncharacterized protein SCHCODRAFT_02483779 [Schizophyllum commune H4-8]|nr:uncharacterized protein SCHCODRAFT_02483779 [Schizophyllum commune H4-8]KAI5899840.1 hypothetical protein SCHCODRAFT_02483779 [Schizophyllum commune H4-8]